MNPAPSLAALCLLLTLSTLGLGCWASTFKAARGWRYELYYLDFVLGLLACLLAYAALGGLGQDGSGVPSAVLNSGRQQWLIAFGAGAIFSFGSLLLLAAVSVAGMAASFPIAFGAAFILSGAIRVALRGEGLPPAICLPWLIMGAAIALAAAAMQQRATALHEAEARAGTARSLHRPGTWKGLVLALGAGIMLAVCPLLLEAGIGVERSPRRWAAVFLLSAALCATSLACLIFLLRLPIEGEPVGIGDYCGGTLWQHLLGALGGAIWFGGCVAWLMATANAGAAGFSPAASEAGYWSAPVLAAVTGGLAMKEFTGTGRGAQALMLASALLCAAAAFLAAFQPGV